MFDYTKRDFSFIEDLKTELKILRLLEIPDFFTLGFITCKKGSERYLIVVGNIFFLCVEKEHLFDYMYLILLGAPLFLGLDIKNFSYSNTRDEVIHSGKTFKLQRIENVQELTKIFERTSFVFKDSKSN